MNESQCGTCGGTYRRGAFTVCSNPFHLCRDCVHSAGKVVLRCAACELLEAKAVHQRAIDLIVYLTRKHGIDVETVYSEDSRAYKSIKTLLEQIRKRRNEVGEWESH